MKKYKSCDDETLRVDLYLNGNIWQKDYELPIDYFDEPNGLSTVDLVEMVHRIVPLSEKATIQIIELNRGFEKERRWDWSKLTKTTYLLYCADIKNMKENKYIGINIVPHLEPSLPPRQSVRPRSSANNFLPIMVKEPWRPDEATGHYPQRWLTLFITDPKTGKRVKNPKLPVGLEEPRFSLPQLGWGNYLAAKHFARDVSAVEYINEFSDQVRSILRIPPDSLTPDEREKVYDLLERIDFDYTLLKQELDKDPDISRWVQRGFDILPDLERGQYMLVYTGVKKKSADELKSVAFLQCALCSKEAQFVNKQMMKMFCSSECYALFRK